MDASSRLDYLRFEGGEGRTGIAVALPATLFGRLSAWGDRTERFEGDPVRVVDINETTLSIGEILDPLASGAQGTAIPTGNIRGIESKVVELRTLPERLVKPVPFGIEVQLDPMPRSREDHLNILASVLHPAFPEDAEAEGAVEPNRTWQVPDSNPGVEESHGRGRHRPPVPVRAYPLVRGSTVARRLVPATSSRWLK